MNKKEGGRSTRDTWIHFVDLNELQRDHEAFIAYKKAMSSDNKRGEGNTQVVKSGITLPLSPNDVGN